MGAEKLEQGHPLLDKTLIDAFIDSVEKTMSTLANTQVSSSKPCIKKEDSAPLDVAGVIGVASDNMKGTITVGFQKEAIFEILKNMLEEEHSEVNEEVTDAVGELTNVIYGDAKAFLNRVGYSFQMAIPVVITGASKIKTSSQGVTLVIPFGVSSGCFYIEFTIH